jgi:excinuclease ABC subunit A
MTKLYMSGVGKIEMPRKRRPLGGAFLTVKGAQENNLKGIDVRIPLGTMTCITGVSGSGKSSLVHDVIYGALARHFHGEVERVGRYDEILGIENLSDVVMLDQSPIGRSSRSNPVTYIKAYDEIRKVMVCTPEARSKGLTPASFSFNVPGGRCEACQGEGVQRIEMQFLADVVVTCEECGGRRFKKEILSVKYKGKNIDEILSLTASEAMLFFQDIPAIARKLGILGEVGLDYLRLGQPAPSLSGGEAQRIKIARELGRKEGKGILYIMDEPTVGLHADDVRKLLNVINRLVDAGNTVVVIEHNLEVIKSADYVIDLGPDGGERGGYVVGTGRPEDIAQIASSYTGKYLQRVLYKIGWELNPQARS